MYSLGQFNIFFIRAYVDSLVIPDNYANDDVGMYCMGNEL
jgi:hypothetical protein